MPAGSLGNSLQYKTFSTGSTPAGTLGTSTGTNPALYLSQWPTTTSHVVIASTSGVVLVGCAISSSRRFFGASLSLSPLVPWHCLPLLVFSGLLSGYVDGHS